jgi:hypothetical protein
MHRLPETATAHIRSLATGHPSLVSGCCKRQCVFHTPKTSLLAPDYSFWSFAESNNFFFQRPNVVESCSRKPPYYLPNSKLLDQITPRACRLLIRTQLLTSGDAKCTAAVACRSATIMGNATCSEEGSCWVSLLCHSRKEFKEHAPDTLVCRSLNCRQKSTPVLPPTYIDARHIHCLEGQHRW